MRSSAEVYEQLGDREKALELYELAARDACRRIPSRYLVEVYRSSRRSLEAERPARTRRSRS